MNDRDFKKWRPFNSVVPSKELLKRDKQLDIPILSKDEISDFEEKLKQSLYLKSSITVTYMENNKVRELRDYVIKIDVLKKNIYFKNKVINFRQIINIK